MRAYKCVKIEKNEIYSGFGKLDGSVVKAYCCLEYEQQAFDLLREWVSDNIECGQPVTYNAIIEIEGPECEDDDPWRYDGCYPDTKWVTSFTVTKILYQL